jgi:hypothetical protein
MYQSEKMQARGMILAQYAPYAQRRAFWDGAVAYDYGNYNNPYGDDADGQAWDRGLEYAMRLQRAGL